MTEQSTESADRQTGESRVTWCLPWNWPWGIWAFLAAVCVMLIPFGIRALMLAGVPDMAEPFDVEDFARWDVPADEDAFTDYREAVRLREQIVAKSPQPPDKFDDVYLYFTSDHEWTPVDDSLKQWLDVHSEAMAIWKRGTERLHGLNSAPDKLTYASVLKTIQDLRAFAQLAMLEEARCIQENRPDEAWQWAHATYRSGGHVSHRGCIIQGLVGVALHVTGACGMARWAELPEVSSEQLKAALAQVRSDYALYESQSNMLKTEYLTARNTLRSPEWLEVSMLGSSHDLASRSLAAANRMQYWVRGEPELTICVWRQILANQMPEIDKPIVARRPSTASRVVTLFDSDPKTPLAPGQLDPVRIQQIAQRSPVARMLMPAFVQVDSALLKQASHQAAIETVLAAQAYRRDHGSFPEKLSQLVPDYLEIVPVNPADPMGGPVVYQYEGPTRAAVSSLGHAWLLRDGGGRSEQTVK